MHVLISGATGLIGTAVTQDLIAAGHTVVPLLRGQPRESASPMAWWDPPRQRIDLGRAGNIEAVIHLAGENIASRWTAAKKERIRSSRVDGTKLLCQAIAERDTPPSVLISASATGYYGTRGNELLTEESPAGTGFLSRVCREWEAATQAAHDHGIRVVHLRTGIVLDRRGGALAKMLPLFKLGLGGRVGDGRQFWSWITLEDAVRAISFLLDHPLLAGSINTVSPNPVTNREFTRALSLAVRRPAVVTLPSILARSLFGRMAEETLLASARVYPRRLLEAGFQFKQPALEPALTTACFKKP